MAHTDCFGPWKLIRRCLLHAGVLLFAASLLVPQGVAAQTAVQMIARTEAEGYGRMILTFPELPKYHVSVVSGVLVLEFDEPISTVLDATTVKTPEFILVGRADPDGKALRFALAQNVRINTMEAGEQLFIDLLPSNWQGVAPGLPPEVVAALARRAEEAEKAAEIEARRKALEDSKYKLRIHVGQQPTFSRIVFDWGARVGVELSRKGNVVTVAFDQLARPPMDRLKADPPRYVKSARSYFDETGLKVDLVIEPGSDVRGFREENTYIVDISAPQGAVNDDNEPVTLAGADEKATPKTPEELIELNRDTTAVEPPPAQVDTPDSTAADEPEAPEMPAAEGIVDPDDTGPHPPPMAQDAPAKSEDAPEKADEVPDVVVSKFDLDADGVEVASADNVDADADPNPDAMSDAPSTQEDEPAAADEDPIAKEPPSFGERPQVEVEVEAPAPRPEPVAPTKPEPLSPVIATADRDGTVLRVKFPFANTTPAAVFRRSDVLWLVFESQQGIDLAKVKELDDDHFRSVEVMQSGELQIVRFRIRPTTHPSASVEANSWVLALADLVITPTAPVSLKRGLRSDGRAKVTVEFNDASRVHRIKDPDVGDKLVVVTGFGPQRGVVKAQQFVEFLMLKTAHGLAVKPYADDLRVRLLDDGVLITRSGGLTLSSSRIGDLGDSLAAVVDNSRLGFVDYERWAPGGTENFMKRINLLENAIASLDPTQTVGPRLDLVRLYLANDLGSEAIGQLEIVAETDPELQTEPMFAAMRGIANVLMHRPDAAWPDLTNFSLKDDPHTALWRGIMEVQKNRWSAAVASFRSGEYAIGDYPQREQVRFRIAAMRAAIETEDYSTADFHFKLLPKITLEPGETAELLVLQGRLLDGLGRSIEAFDVLEEALNSGDRKAEAEALYYYGLLGRRLERFDRDRHKDMLETLAATWRGDDLELNTLRRLASIYVEEEEFGQALQVMKVAVTNYPKAALAREIHDDMSALFEDLYLHGKADALNPVEALALYYEYRELTPVGRHGDEMIRKLADRLISVDLLDQAVEILNHQVDKRLIGAARAQVAAKLAAVHLMNRKPGRALNAIRRTRQAVLPEHIQAQRRLIEARALAELGRTDAAIDLLAHLDGEDALRQRAEAYWMGERWQNAGEAFERILGDASSGDAALSDLERTDVLRAAIAYVLADDKIGLDRLRQRFETKMSQTPDESAFKVVTRPLNRNSIAFRNLAKEIAGIDTLEAFLRKFRETFNAVSTSNAELER